MRDVYEVLDRDRYTHRDPKSGKFWDDEKGLWVTEDQIFKDYEEAKKNGNTKESSTKDKEGKHNKKEGKRDAAGE